MYVFCISDEWKTSRVPSPLKSVLVNNVQSELRRKDIMNYFDYLFVCIEMEWVKGELKSYKKKLRICGALCT